uniref:Uncharacterized protein n=1 Tax=Oryza brachyantha TaxID=4533 RepID=J3LVW4_ORYBR
MEAGINMVYFERKFYRIFVKSYKKPVATDGEMSRCNRDQLPDCFHQPSFSYISVQQLTLSVLHERKRIICEHELAILLLSQARVIVIFLKRKNDHGTHMLMTCINSTFFGKK